MEKIKIKKQTLFFFKKKQNIQKDKSTDPTTVGATVTISSFF